MFDVVRAEAEEGIDKVVTSEKYINANFIEKFIKELLYRLLANPDNTVSSGELNEIKNRLFFKECG